MSAISSLERAGLARLEADVGHAHDRLAREAVGAHAAAGAVEPDLGGGLARAEEAGEHALARRSACCGPPRPRRPSGRSRARRQRRVGGHVTCSEPKRSAADRVRGDEAGAGVGGLAPEHAVELDGVADRLVDLRRRAARRRGSASWSCRRGRRARAAARPPRSATRGACAGQVERQEALIARLLHVAPERRGIGADLRLLAVHGDGREAPAALGQDLLAERALGRGEQLVDADAPGSARPCARSRARRSARRPPAPAPPACRRARRRRGRAPPGSCRCRSRAARRRAPRRARPAAPPRSPARVRAPASASALPVPRTAAKPHAPPTRTRTPIPSESSKSAWSTSPLRVASRSDWVRTKRASAYSDRPAAASIRS